LQWFACQRKPLSAPQSQTWRCKTAPAASSCGDPQQKSPGRGRGFNGSKESWIRRYQYFAITGPPKVRVLDFEKRYRRRRQLNMCVSVAADAFLAIVAKMTQAPGIAGAAAFPLIY
jgi:hypothetical protein